MRKDKPFIDSVGHSITFADRKIGGFIVSEQGGIMAKSFIEANAPGWGCF